jgi:broad specificity phosphatase PhoE
MAAASRPVIYYIRHGETDWNVEGRLQGGRDIALNARGREQAQHCGEILRELFARGGREPGSCDYVCSPLLRARETMEIARAELGFAAGGYRTEPALTEISFGDWEGFTIRELRARDPERVVQREQDKWHFLPPGGESYEAVARRVHAWYRGLIGDVVVAAHGGTARGLFAALGIAKPAAPPLIDIAQGVVYIIEGEKLTRYA